MRKKICKVLSTPNDSEMPTVVDANQEVFEAVSENGKRAVVIADDYQWAVMMAEQHFWPESVEVKSRPSATTEPAGPAEVANRESHLSFSEDRWAEDR